MDYHSLNHFCSDVFRDRDERTFHCPECKPAHEHDHSRFCSPYDCPKEIKTARFSGPTRVLPPEEHERLVECIEEVNRLLRTFINDRDPHLLESLRLKFRTMLGRFVRVKVLCNNNEVVIDGELVDVGKDFLVIDNFDHQFIIPYEPICGVKQSKHHPKEKGRHGGELANLKDCCRRQLILNFGEVVAANPFLINIFLGIRLHLYLLDLGKRSVSAHLKNGEKKTGCLVEVEEKDFRILLDKKKTEVKFSELCFIKVEK